ncbi:glycosyltransferase [Flavobacterium sp. ARAG 55.4]|uniref:glycosyltransferase n=1 Tax=Flavobacterium sp. ARAG 55.4 TaxID=3451357 RepID=UPI003F46AEE4
MKIDILMATYNGELYIKSQILSIQSQTFEDWQLIIHDDGSTDNTLQIIEDIASRDKRIILIKDDVEFGNAAYNFMHLLKFSEAEYVMFCDQDDIWFDNKIEVQLTAIQIRNNKIPQVVYSNAYVWIPSEGIKGLATLTFPKKISQFLFLNSGMQGCVALFNRQMCEIMMSYRGTLAMHDHLLHLSALCLGEVTYLPISLMLYRNHQKNVTGSTATTTLDINTVLMKNNFPVVDKKHYRTVLDFYHFFNTKITAANKSVIESYLKMVNKNIVVRFFMLLVSDFQLFNSRVRLIIKLLLRPYINN